MAPTPFPSFSPHFRYLDPPSRRRRRHSYLLNLLFLLLLLFLFLLQEKRGKRSSTVHTLANIGGNGVASAAVCIQESDISVGFPPSSSSSSPWRAKDPSSHPGPIPPSFTGRQTDRPPFYRWERGEKETDKTGRGGGHCLWHFPEMRSCGLGPPEPMYSRPNPPPSFRG